MYCIKESAILAWARYNDLEFIQCACRFTENISKSGDGVGDSKRQQVKMLIKELKKTNPNVDISIFNSIHSVCLDTFAGYKAKGEKHTFLDDYE